MTTPPMPATNVRQTLRDKALAAGVVNLLKFWLSLLLIQPALCALVVLAVALQVWQVAGERGASLGYRMLLMVPPVLAALALVLGSAMLLCRLWKGRWRFWRRSANATA